MKSIDLKAVPQLKYLRTLNLSRNIFKELPEEMGELIHLRYLDLSVNEELEKLPDSLGSLYNLQTLSLIRCRSLKKLPDTMGKLMNLRNLNNKGCYSLRYLPRCLASLTSLQALNLCPIMHDSGVPEALKLGDLGSMDQLQGTIAILMKGSLKDDNVATSEAQKTPLKNKKLYYLELDFEELEEQSHVQALEASPPHHDLEYLAILFYSGTAGPSWMVTCLPNLRFLHLRSWYGCQYLPPLGKLPALETLIVTDMEKLRTVGDEFLGTQTSSSSSSVSFPKLKYVFMGRMREWEQWEGTVGGTDGITIMPCLVSLEVKGCPKLMKLPLFLQNTPVTKISISSCHRSIVVPVMPDNCNIHIDDQREDPVY